MKSMDPKQLLDYIIRPVLKDLNLLSDAAERLLLGTACVESRCGQYVKQLGNGPPSIWTYTYAYPADCVKARGLEIEGIRTPYAEQRIPYLESRRLRARGANRI